METNGDLQVKSRYFVSTHGNFAFLSLIIVSDLQVYLHFHISSPCPPGRFSWLERQAAY
jgi:hypothetical protein